MLIKYMQKCIEAYQFCGNNAHAVGTMNVRLKY